MGLRDSNLPSSNGVIIEGPTDELDAFHLQRTLFASMNSKELELIGSLVSSQFGLYAVFNTIQYSGPIISITNDADSISLLDVSLEVSDTVPSVNAVSDIVPGTNTLRVSLQGTEFSFELPAAPSDSPFQAIGIKLMDSVLIVTLNCTIIDFVILRNTFPPVALANGTVSIFGEDAIVSFMQFWRGTYCTCNY